jgi:hypothetical protein
MLGHASVQQTQRSLNVTDEELRKGLEAGPSKHGAPGGIRTHDLRLRRPTLYPAELRARTGSAAMKMVRPEGVEPPAYRFEACRSIQLSYGRTDGQLDAAIASN